MLFSGSIQHQGGVITTLKWTAGKFLIPRIPRWSADEYHFYLFIKNGTLFFFLSIYYILYIAEQFWHRFLLSLMPQQWTAIPSKSSLFSFSWTKQKTGCRVTTQQLQRLSPEEFPMVENSDKTPTPKTTSEKLHNPLLTLAELHSAISSTRSLFNISTFVVRLRWFALGTIPPEWSVTIETKAHSYIDYI